SAPAIDPARAFVYSYGLDGYVHKHAVGDGSEVTGGGWPALATSKPFEEKSSPALGWATAASGATFLYVSNGGYPGDNGDYQGHLTAIDLASGSQQVFNTLCSDQAVHFVERPGKPDCGQVQAAVWARSGVVYDAARDDIILSTGNGTFDGNHDFGDSVLTLHPDGSGAGGRPLDSYTPSNFQQLQNDDADIGSTAPALLPSVSGSRVAHLAVQGGKDAKLRLLDRDNLSGHGGPGNTGGELGAIVDVPQGGEVLTAIATWSRPSDNSVFIFVGNDNGLSALRVVVDGAGNPSLSTVWQKSGQRTSPLVANGLLYAAGSGVIEALDPSSGARLWSDSAVGDLHWASPVVVNGVLYLADTAGHLTAWTLPATTTLPPPWQSSDVGAVALAGSASAAGDTFTVSGSGDDIWNNADGFRYVYQPLSGDGSIVARVVSAGDTHTWAKAGVMIRETLAAGSRHALMAITPGNGAAFQRRTTTDGISTHAPGPSVTAPYWVRLARSGATLTGSVSSDGSSWTVVGSDTIAMGTDVFIG
ncbi:MAG: hypothetical protein LC659_05280, partial [Myxococcales bacterium]|nr:hypothetical protein [Myxococcales bacterium]